MICDDPTASIRWAQELGELPRNHGSVVYSAPLAGRGEPNANRRRGVDEVAKRVARRRSGSEVRGVVKLLLLQERQQQMEAREIRAGGLIVVVDDARRIDLVGVVVVLHRDAEALEVQFALFGAGILAQLFHPRRK